MGRKPNSVIASRFTRGKKHGQTTNRYTQTCNHCGTFFPTGRPETLYTHLGNCPGLTQIERAEVINEMFNVSSRNDVGSARETSSHSKVKSNMHNDDEFDITGLNVLAGAAENAEDLAIDPQITQDNSADNDNISVSHPPSFYDNQYELPFATTTSGSVWSFTFPTIHESAPSLPEAQTTANSATVFDSPSLRTTQWTFEPILTPSAEYIAHPPSQTPVVFAAQIENQFVYEDERQDVSYTAIEDSERARKSREPYNESKRARIATMRQIGACVRCSRLRKPCDPIRPCKACNQIASKIWVGECTTLNKGHEFVIWFERHLSRARDMQIEANTKERAVLNNFNGHLELEFPLGLESALRFDLTELCVARDDSQGDERSKVAQRLFLIHHKEDLTKKLLEYSIANQELIIERLDDPGVYGTVRVAQGLALRPAEGAESETIWALCKQSDERLSPIFNLWLIVCLLTTNELVPSTTVVSADGERIPQQLLTTSCSVIMSQLHVVLETVLLNCKDHLRKFDANVLNQNYKHLFNLVIGIFLILDMVERYSCFIHRQIHPDFDYNIMLNQANSLAHKYAYCVQNIQMMPKLSFGNDHSSMMVSKASTGKIDHELQHAWIKDLCISKNDLEGCLSGWGDNEWAHPSGRLWAQLFVPINR